jgi:hypothetical protein
MKNTLLAISVFVLLLANSAFVIAGEVSSSIAEKAAQNWLRHSMTDQALTKGVNYTIIGEEPIIFNNKTVGYNFLLYPTGHIIVPSRDELPVVKLFSFESTISMADNSNAAQWIKEELSLLNNALDDHRAEMAMVDHAKTKNGLLWASFASGDVSFSPENPLDTAGVGTLGPLLSTAWDQEDPYNMYTPLWYDGQKTLTGCVATAAAQILKFWNYPATGQGTTSYTWNNGSVNKTLSANFASSSYGWGSMTNTYGSTSSTAQRQAVAKLMSDVGIAYHMEYGKSQTGGSGAVTTEGATVFPTYFGYKSSIKAVARSSYSSDSAWMQVFKTEIQNGRPAAFAIRDPNAGGHSIVVDGYRDSPSEQIHLNLGWSGSYNGWYASNNIVTGSYRWSDVNYQKAVIGIEPSVTSTTPTASTKAATSVSASGATLNGTVNPNGVSVSGSFEYGTTTSYGSATSYVSLGSGRSAIPITADVSGLTCGGTTYHYRTVATTSGGTNYNGGDATFTTSACSQTKPTVTTNAATGVGQASATLNGTANPNGVSTTAYFQYGTSTTYGSSTASQSIGSGSSSSALTASISGLTCGGTTYHYLAVATNSGGTNYGTDITFTTSACGQISPTVATSAATSIGQTSATLNGTVNPKGVSTTGYFQYGTTNSYGSMTSSQSIGSGSSAVALTAALSGLTCGGTTYHCRAVATNSGGPSYGNDVMFSTSACTNITPNPFSFTSQMNVAQNSVATSNVIIVSGIEASSRISTSAGSSYSINGGAYTSAAGLVNNNDKVTVRVTSSSSYATTTTATLTIGGVAGTFSVTTVSVAGGKTNLIQNPDFESGDTGWVSSSSEGYEIITNGINWGNFGSDWFAFLGGDVNLSEYIYQDVAIPSNATAAALNFYYLILTDETSSATAYDKMTVELVDPATGSSLAVLKTLSNLDATADWVISQTFDLLAYKGRTVRLKFSDTTNDSLATMFLVDNVTLMVTGPNAVIVQPTVVSTLPASAAANVTVNSSINATFSVAMEASTINAVTFSLSPSITGTVSYDAATTTAIFTPAASLAPNTTYTATITTGVTDATGNPMAANRTWSFTTASGGSSSNLLANGDFEDGHTGWTETNNENYYNINLNSGIGHSNSNWYIYTGYINNLVSATYQDVSIPANVSQASLQFWYKISTDEVSSSTVWDTMDVQIVNTTTGSVIKTLKTFSNLDETIDWVQSSQFDLTSYKGQTVRLNFLTTTDSYSPTAFRVDDVVVMATGSTTTYAVTPSAGSNGSISPATAQTVSSGATTSFTVTPATGYQIASVTGCGGTLSGNTYTTGAITGACTVSASFSAVAPTTYTVTPSAGSNGSLSPATAQTVTSGATTIFTVTPASGYQIANVTGCGGTLTGTTYTTGAITGACTVSASFSAIPVATPLKGDINGDGKIDIFDALLTLQYSLNLIPHDAATDAQYLATADVAPLDIATMKPKGDSKIDIMDALVILQRSVNLLSW